jgi:hypothetical protein
MARWTLIAIVGAALAACGGHKSQPADPGSGGETADESGGGMTQPCNDNGMCPPETLDRIKELLDSKRITMSRCLSDAVTAGQAGKNAKGKVTVEFVISTSGQAKNVKIGSSTVKSKAVEDCVVGKVEAMAFPEVPKDLDWSYTYGFEDN